MLSLPCTAASSAWTPAASWNKLIRATSVTSGAGNLLVAYIKRGSFRFAAPLLATVTPRQIARDNATLSTPSHWPRPASHARPFSSSHRRASRPSSMLGLSQAAPGNGKEGPPTKQRARRGRSEVVSLSPFPVPTRGCVCTRYSVLRATDPVPAPRYQLARDGGGDESWPHLAK